MSGSLTKIPVLKIIYCSSKTSSVTLFSCEGAALEVPMSVCLSVRRSVINLKF